MPQGSITEAQCVECVRFRTVCETWNGVMVRERNTINTLCGMFGGLSFMGVSGEKDFNYAVDYEVYSNDALLFALQIKPKSYQWNAPYIAAARYANEQKNAAYTGAFGVPVITVIADGRGNIDNTEAINMMRQLSGR